MGRAVFLESCINLYLQGITNPSTYKGGFYARCQNSPTDAGNQDVNEIHSNWYQLRRVILFWRLA